MKVVLFCGGLGTRLREFSDVIPKPLVNVGYRPIIWHLMRQYAHHGHKDFVLALGYRGDMIREYFLKYNEAMSNDFELSDGGRTVRLLKQDIQDWRITFVDTGLNSNIGQRLLRVKPYLEGEETFLANYSDGLSDVPINDVVKYVQDRNALAGFVAVRSSQSFHIVRSNGDGIVTGMGPMNDDNLLINGGFFVLRRKIFDYIQEGQELVEEPFARLMEEQKLVAYKYLGFWQAMDTFKDKMTFDSMEARGECPWMVWKKEP